MKISRRTALRQAQGVLSPPKDEIDDAPGSQGAKRENSWDYLSVEQRREAGAPDAAAALGWDAGCSVD